MLLLPLRLLRAAAARLLPGREQLPSPLAAPRVPLLRATLLCPQAFTNPDMTIGKGPLHVKEHGIGGVGKGVLSYRLERYDENRKLHTVEIFRNAAAVDEYNNGIPKLGPLPWCLCCFCPASTPMTLCEGMTLAPPCCRQGWPANGATTYGDPEECAKITNDFGRTGKAMKAGELKEWAKEEGFSNPPTPEELVAKFVRTEQILLLRSACASLTGVVDCVTG